MVSDGNKRNRLYPIPSNPNKQPFQAHFEDLQQFVSLGFDCDRYFLCRREKAKEGPSEVAAMGEVDKIDAAHEDQLVAGPAERKCIARWWNVVY